MGGTCAARADLVLFRGSSTGVTPQGAPRHPDGTRRWSDRAKAQEDSATARWRIVGAGRVSGDLGLCSWIAGLQSRRSGPVKNVALDGAAGGGGPRSSCPRDVGRQIPKACGEELERGRQRQDDDLHSRPTTPLRKERCSASSVRSSSGPGRARLLGRPRGLSRVLAEASASTSIEAPLDHAVCQGFGRAGGMEAALFGESSRGR